MLDILLKWNRWGSHPLPGGFLRDVTNDLIPMLSNNEIIVLTGPRRSGKTTILYQLIDHLENSGIPQKAILHINLEEPALGLQLDLGLLDKLYNAYRENIYPSGKAFILLDEIQNISGWERWVRARNETEDIKIIITGSSAHLMSRELGTLLTGRHLTFNVWPLSFAEFLRVKGIEQPKNLLPSTAPALIQHALNEYITWGGFPKVALVKTDLERAQLLKQYFDDILFKDIAVRYKIRDIAMLRNIALYLITQTASLISYRRIAAQFNVSQKTAEDYCHYIQEAFLVDFISFYSFKASERSRRPQKVHALDPGLRNVLSFSHSQDNGRTIESLVFQHLKQKYEHVFYWKGKQEVDFVIQEDRSITQLIQIVYQNDHANNTIEREISALQEASASFKQAKLRLITYKSIPECSDKSIETLPLWLFLLL